MSVTPRLNLYLGSKTLLTRKSLKLKVTTEKSYDMMSVRNTHGDHHTYSFGQSTLENKRFQSPAIGGLEFSDRPPAKLETEG